MTGFAHILISSVLLKAFSVALPASPVLRSSSLAAPKFLLLPVQMTQSFLNSDLCPVIGVSYILNIIIKTYWPTGQLLQTL